MKPTPTLPNNLALVMTCAVLALTISVVSHTVTTQSDLAFDITNHDIERADRQATVTDLQGRSRKVSVLIAEYRALLVEQEAALTSTDGFIQ